MRMVDGECSAWIIVSEGLSRCVKTYRRLLGAATWMRLDFKGTTVPLNAFRCIEMILQKGDMLSKRAGMNQKDRVSGGRLYRR